MLKANVGLSRKVSENFNSTGFSLNLEGEILATLDDPESVIERIRELFNTAEEALARQVSDSQSNDAIARRDGNDQPHPVENGRSHDRPHSEPDSPSSDRNGKPRNDEPATNKQIQFLQTLAKRQKLFGPKLDAFVEEAIGRSCTIYDLTKKEAGAVINALNPEEARDNRPRR